MIFSKGFDTAGVFGGGGDRLRQDGDGVSCETPILGKIYSTRDLDLGLSPGLQII